MSRPHTVVTGRQKQKRIIISKRPDKQDYPIKDGSQSKTRTATIFATACDSDSDSCSDHEASDDCKSLTRAPLGIGETQSICEKIEKMSVTNSTSGKFRECRCYDCSVICNKGAGTGKCYERPLQPCSRCIKCYVWSFYWPLKGTAQVDPSLIIKNVYVGFNNNNVVTKWTATLPTSKLTANKNPLFSVTVTSGATGISFGDQSTGSGTSAQIAKTCPINNNSNFDFEIKFDNDAIEPTKRKTIKVSQQSKMYPLLLGQYVLVIDPAVVPSDPDTGNSAVDPTNVMAAISYFVGKNDYYNPLTKDVDPGSNAKNLVFANQKQFIHINEIDIPVKLTISASNEGENIANVLISVMIPKAVIRINEYPGEVVESIVGPPTRVRIEKIVVFIQGVYFLTYATYGGSITVATEFGQVPTTADSRQVPLQLEAMILYDRPVVPVINLLANNSSGGDSVYKESMNTLYKNILLTNP